MHRDVAGVSLFTSFTPCALVSYERPCCGRCRVGGDQPFLLGGEEQALQRVVDVADGPRVELVPPGPDPALELDEKLSHVARLMRTTFTGASVTCP